MRFASDSAYLIDKKCISPPILHNSDLDPCSKMSLAKIKYVLSLIGM